MLALIDSDPEAISPSRAVSEIVQAEGDLDLAAERIFGLPEKGKASPRSRLIALIAQDPYSVNALSEQLRTLSLLNAFQTVCKVGIVVDGTLEKQQVGDLAKLYKDLLGIVENYTSKSRNNIQSGGSLDLSYHFSELPSEIQEAIQVLSLPVQNGQVSGSDLVETLALNGWSGGKPPPNAANGDD